LLARCCTDKSKRLRRHCESWDCFGCWEFDHTEYTNVKKKESKKKRKGKERKGKKDALSKQPAYLFFSTLVSGPSTSVPFRSCIRYIAITINIMANPNAGHFFQTSESLVAEQRKASKAQNKLGRPIKLSSKLLAVTADPFDERAVYVAEAAGEVRRVVLEVSSFCFVLGSQLFPFFPFSIPRDTTTCFGHPA
jgi:hypothetical protein